MLAMRAMSGMSDRWAGLSMIVDIAGQVDAVQQSENADDCSSMRGEDFMIQ